MTDTLVLCYHAISSTWNDSVAVSERRFRAQISALRRLGYRGVTFSEAVLANPAGRRVAVTFDDAFLSVLVRARPVLDAVGWPGTVFAVTDHAGEGRPAAWPRLDAWVGTAQEGELRTMDWSQVAELASAGWEIGSHTCRHPHLTQIDDDALRQELAASRTAISEHFGECRAIAYPYGDVDARVVTAARAAGYSTGAALPARLHDERSLEWPRVGVYDLDHLLRFLLKIAPARRHRAVPDAGGALGR